MERVVIVGSGNLAEALAQAVARSGLATGTVVRPQRRTGGGCRRTRRNAVDGRPGTAGRRGHIPDLCERQGRRGGSRGAAPACRSRRRPYCGERTARCASRPHAPRRLLSVANLHQRAQRGFFANPPLPRNQRRIPSSRTRSLRPPSFAHGGVGRLGLPRQGAPRGRFSPATSSTTCTPSAKASSAARACPSTYSKPLLAETAAKALDAASPADVQTGPAVRNDLHTMARHRALLAADPRLENIYSIISNNIWETSKKI